MPSFTSTGTTMPPAIVIDLENRRSGQQWCGNHPTNKDKKATAERNKSDYIYDILIAFVCQINAHLDTWLGANVTIAELGLLLDIADQPDPLPKNRQVHLAVKPNRFEGKFAEEKATRVKRLERQLQPVNPFFKNEAKILQHNEVTHCNRDLVPNILECARGHDGLLYVLSQLLQDLSSTVSPRCNERVPPVDREPGRR